MEIPQRNKSRSRTQTHSGAGPRDGPEANKADGPDELVKQDSASRDSAIKAGNHTIVVDDPKSMNYGAVDNDNNPSIELHDNNYLLQVQDEDAHYEPSGSHDDSDSHLSEMKD